MENGPIAQNIRRLREAHHWTQEELALKSDVDVRTIQRAEMRNHGWLLTILVTAVGCASTGENFRIADAALQAEQNALANVRVTLEAASVAGCKDLGMVQGVSERIMITEGGLSAYQKPYSFDAKGRIASRAQELGGNTVVLGAGSTPDKMIGEAYLCEVPSAAAQKQ